MSTQQDISTHYTHGNLIAAIRDGIASLGKTVATVTIDDLAPVDEFHIGGRQASIHFLDQLDLTPDKHVLDVGSGLGGPARFAASRYDCHVDGLDLTPEYVETGQEICRWVGLADRISLHLGSALSMPFADGTFDGAYMLHVGMNIEDKAKLCLEVGRVLRPGSLFGIYDVMKTGDGDLTFPFRGRRHLHRARWQHPSSTAARLYQRVLGWLLNTPGVTLRCSSLSNCGPEPWRQAVPRRLGFMS